MHVHVVVGFADGGVGGRVGAGLVLVVGGGLGGCVAEAGEAEGGGLLLLCVGRPLLEDLEWPL